MSVQEFFTQNPGVSYAPHTISKRLSMKRNAVTKECFELEKKGIVQRVDPMQVGWGGRIENSRIFRLVTEPNTAKA